LEVHITTERSRYSQNGSRYFTEKKEQAGTASGSYFEIISYGLLSVLGKLLLCKIDSWH